MPDPSPHPQQRRRLFQQVRALLVRGRNHLRRRHVVRGAVFGLWGGLGLALVVAVVSRFWWQVPVEAWWVAAGLAGVGLLAGALAGAAWTGLRPREVALLLDRTLGTDELLVTALHLEKAPPSWSQQAVLDRLERRLAARPKLSEALPVRLPRRSGWLGLLAVAVVAAFLVPPRPGAAWQPAEPTVAQQEGERLEERVAEIDGEYDVELASELETEVERLADELSAGTLEPEEARERIDELQRQLEQLEQDLEKSRDLLDDLDAAAQELSAEQSTRELGDALDRGDMDGAADAARSLESRLSGASEEERRRAGEALERAGRRLAGSDSEQLRQAGERMARAGQQARSGQQQQGQQSGQQGQQGQQGQGQQGQQSGQQGQQSGQQGQQAGQQGQQGGQQGQQAGQQGQQSGQQGQQSGQQGQQSGQQGQQSGQQGQQSGQQGQQAGGQQGQGGGEMEELAQALERQQQFSERLQQDEQRLARSQQLNGALEGSEQRLGGGSDDVAQGQSSQGGQGGEQQGQQVAATDYGTGHTWEDQGTSPGSAGSHHDADRQSDRQGGREIDDFERLYDPIRLEGGQELLTSVDGQVDEQGHMDTLPTRLTGGSEDAATPTLDVPDDYRQAADEALSGERVPAGYREAVKDYFDSME